MKIKDELKTRFQNKYNEKEMITLLEKILTAYDQGGTNAIKSLISKEVKELLQSAKKLSSDITETVRKI